MVRIYDKDCVFFRAGNICAAHKWICFLCEFRMKKIDTLAVKDHVNLVFARNTLKLSFVFSLLALTISLITLLFEVCRYVFSG